VEFSYFAKTLLETKIVKYVFKVKNRNSTKDCHFFKLKDWKLEIEKRKKIKLKKSLGFSHQ
jgi:hypothetical protein